MGGGSRSESNNWGVSKQSSSSYSGTFDSAISIQQAGVLQNASEIFETDFMPSWKSAYSEIDKSYSSAKDKIASAEKYSLGTVTDNLALIDQAIADVSMNSPVMKSTMALQTKEINSAFDAAQKATAQNLAKQNLLGKGSGVSAALTAQNDRARASALSDAYNNTLLQNNTQKQNLLGLRSEAANTGIAANQNLLSTTLTNENETAAQRTNMLNNLIGVMPNPTNELGYHSISESESKGSSINQGYSKSASAEVGLL